MEPEWEALVTNPLKLADEIEAGSDVRVMAYDERHRRLLATALRLAEAADDNDFPWWPRDMDGDPVRGATLDERVCPYCEQIRGDGHTRTCPVAAYRAAREGA